MVGAGRTFPENRVGQKGEALFGVAGSVAGAGGGTVGTVSAKTERTHLQMPATTPAPDRRAPAPSRRAGGCRCHGQSRTAAAYAQRSGAGECHHSGFLHRPFLGRNSRATRIYPPASFGRFGGHLAGGAGRWGERRGLPQSQPSSGSCAQGRLRQRGPTTAPRCPLASAPATQATVESRA